jgi:hypothetical protein
VHVGHPPQRARPWREPSVIVVLARTFDLLNVAEVCIYLHQL